MMSRAIDQTWVADRHCTDVDDGGQWLGGGVEQAGHARDRGGTDRGMEDGWGVEASARRLDRIGTRATGWSGHGGVRGDAGCRGGSGVEEPATPGCSWTGAWRMAGA
jgi:hypothetical protein